MAFKDGMYAISSVLKVAAVGSAALSIIASLIGGGFLVGLTLAVGLFLMFWTPAWIIKKFIQ